MPLDTPFLIASLIQPLHFLSRIMLPSKPRYRMSLPGSRCIRALRQSQVHSQDTQSCSDLPHPCMEYGSGYTPFVKLTSTGFLPHFNLSLLSAFYLLFPLPSFNFCLHSLPPVLSISYIISHLVVYGTHLLTLCLKFYVYFNILPCAQNRYI